MIATRPNRYIAAVLTQAVRNSPVRILANVTKEATAGKWDHESMRRELARRRLVFPGHIERFALHEAGHIVTAAHYGIGLWHSTIDGIDGQYAAVWHDRPARPDIATWIAVGGAVAESIALKTFVQTGGEDHEEATRYGGLIGLEEGRQRVDAVLRDRWKAVEAIAVELLVKRRLTRTEINEILGQHGLSVEGE
jgi:hypothetical protein